MESSSFEIESATLILLSSRKRFIGLIVNCSFEQDSRISNILNWMKGFGPPLVIKDTKFLLSVNQEMLPCQPC